MNWAVGIDVGGTNLKAVAVTADGDVLHRESRATEDGTASATDWARHGRAAIAISAGVAPRDGVLSGPHRG